MFIIVDTNNATHLAINIPTEVAAQALPSIANMFEKNTIFVQNGWSGFELKTPTITIGLGDSYKFDRGDTALLIADNPQVIDTDFEIATPEVFFKNTELIKKKDTEIKNLRDEIRALKYQVSSLTEDLRIKNEEEEK